MNAVIPLALLLLCAASAAPLHTHPRFLRAQPHHQQSALKLAQHVADLSDAEFAALDEKTNAVSGGTLATDSPPASLEQSHSSSAAGSAHKQAADDGEELNSDWLRVRPMPMPEPLSKPTRTANIRPLVSVVDDRVSMEQVFADGSYKVIEEPEEVHAARREALRRDDVHSLVFELERQRRATVLESNRPRVSANKSQADVDCRRFYECDKCVGASCRWAVRKSPIFPGRTAQCVESHWTNSDGNWAWVDTEDRCPSWPTERTLDVEAKDETRLAVKLSIQIGEYWYSCTGWICGESMLCTAGHCILSTDGTRATKVYAIPTAGDSKEDTFNSDTNLGGFTSTDNSLNFQIWDRPSGYATWTGRWFRYNDFVEFYPKYNSMPSSERTVDDYLRAFSRDMVVLELDWKIATRMKWWGYWASLLQMHDENTVLGYPTQVQMSSNGLDVVGQYVRGAGQYNTVGSVYDFAEYSDSGTWLTSQTGVIAGGHSGGPSVAKSNDKWWVVGGHSTSNRLTSSDDVYVGVNIKGVIKNAQAAWSAPTPQVDLIEEMEYGTKGYTPVGATLHGGDSISATVLFRNLGLLDAAPGSITVTIVLSTNQFISSKDYHLCHYVLKQGLKANYRFTWTPTCKLPADVGFLGSQRYVGAVFQHADDLHPDDNFTMLDDDPIYLA